MDKGRLVILSHLISEVSNADAFRPFTTQANDGSWHVKSRSIWLQPYLETGFPYGQDQFISTAGTAWASMALSLVEESRK